VQSERGFMRYFGEHFRSLAIVTVDFGLPQSDQVLKKVPGGSSRLCA
jgi:hypothetical protein